VASIRIDEYPEVDRFRDGGEVSGRRDLVSVKVIFGDPERLEAPMFGLLRGLNVPIDRLRAGEGQPDSLHEILIDSCLGAI